KIDLAKLSKLERARLELSTRQFADAMSSYEDSFFDPNIRPAKWVTFDALTSYLKIAVGVKGDLDRSKKTMEAILAKRKMCQNICSGSCKHGLIRLQILRSKTSIKSRRYQVRETCSRRRKKFKPIPP